MSDLNFIIFISVILILRDRSIILAIGHFSISLSVGDPESVPIGSDQRQRQHPSARKARVLYPVPS